MDFSLGDFVQHIVMVLVLGNFLSCFEFSTVRRVDGSGLRLIRVTTSGRFPWGSPATPAITYLVPSRGAVRWYQPCL